MTNFKSIAGKARNWTRSIQAFMLVGLVLILGCSGGGVGPNPGPDPVFNADGGFVITQSMLDKRFNKITFPGTHNSYASGWAGHCNNQDLTITAQLENGIRYIELDIDKDLYVNHNGYCAGYLTPRLLEIKSYVMEHPNQIFTIRISDLSPTTPSLGNEPSPAEAYAKMNASLATHGLDEYIFNWDPTKPNDDSGRCFIPNPWPTLREMINSGKNVMFFHNESYGEHGIIDEAYVLGLSYNSTGGQSNTAQLQENFCKLMPFWDPPRSRQKNGRDRLFYIECCPDFQAAGSHQDAAKNNDGRKLYQLAKQHETEILPDNRVVNYINIDYYMTSSAGHLPIDVVDACNRLNYERLGSDWEHSECFWPLYPYEFDASRVEHLSQASSIKAEVDEAITYVKSKQSTGGLEYNGKIVSTTVDGCNDWRRLPEWAVDNDMFTRWAGSSSGPNHTWGIDLGEYRSVDEIAIAWEYPHRRPGFNVYASDDDSRFADGISNSELIDDEGWVIVAEGVKMQTDNQFFWDVLEFSEQGVTSWRYIKIKVTDPGPEEVQGYYPSFWEIRLYGPAK